MTIDEANLLHDKAQTKKDGVYSFKGHLWAVKDSRFIAFITPAGEFLQRSGSFNIVIGNLNSIERWHWKKHLIEWLKKNK